MSDATPPAPNPYSAPSTLEPTEESLPVGGRPAVFQHALQLSRWQLFFAVLCFLAFGLVVLYLLMMLVAMGGIFGGTMQLGRLSFATCATGLFTLVYLVVGLLFVRSSTAAKRFANAPESSTLVAMLESQLWLWRIMGGLAFVGAGLWLVGMLLAMLWG